MESGRVEKSTGKHVVFEKKKETSKLDDFCMFGQTVRGLKEFC